MEKVYGLVICGGKSTRMGKDKGMINYNGQPQRYYLYDMLKPLCDEVFISCNSEQAKDVLPGYNVIADAEEYFAIGPMAALMTALDKYPDASFLVVGCDYPFIRPEHLGALLEKKGETAIAAAYYTITDNAYEPLIALYKNEMRHVLQERYENENYSLRAALEHVNATKIFPEIKESITSVDTPADYKKAVDKINNKTR